MAKFKGTFKNGVKGSFSHSCSLVVLLMGASSCASLPTGGALNGSNQTGKGRFDVNSDAHAYQELEALYRKGLLDSTESRAVFFLKHYPKSAFVPSVENLRGLILLDRKKPEAAARRFEKALETHEKRGSLLEDSPESAHHHHYIYLNLATAQLALQHWDEANQALAKIDPSVMDALNRTKVGYLKAKIRDQQGFPLDAARQILTESESFTGSESPGPITSLQGSLRKLGESVLGKIHDPQVLEALLKEHERSPFADLLLYRLSLKLRGRGQSAQAQPYLEALVRNFPKSPFYADALKQLTAPPAASPSSSTVIGVLLPTTGKLAKYGAKSLQGIELAFELFNSTAKDSRFQLVIEDSGEDPETALLALERLVNEHQVSAVIGPLLSKGAERVAQKAQDFRIPLISLARKTTPPNDFVFQSGLTQQLQAAEIARHALESLKLKRFAILYPDDKMGLEQAHAFWDAVESQGGQVMAIESYPPGETDFRKPVDRLVGLHYLDARQRELDALAQQREANGIKKRTRKTEQFYDLKPIVDFEAVFIPDEPKVAGQIFPTFSYRDVDQMKFLGTSSWNSPDFLNRVQNYGELCSWVDSFSQGSTLASLSSFKDLYQATFHQEPTSLEATAYDAALILKSTLEDSSPGVSPEELKGKLMKVKNFPGVSGPITYQSGQYKRPLLFLTIQNGHFTEFRPELTQKENSR